VLTGCWLRRTSSVIPSREKVFGDSERTSGRGVLYPQAGAGPDPGAGGRRGGGAFGSFRSPGLTRGLKELFVCRL
jgi:hypothetical protein